ncbi:MAG TPA: beta-ketoacyl-[acyl-carrier-protein] synthase family protein [Phycisphaerae bacterium]|nr:beta-ketoacyl-[acyl-carrier-protein] synthase family protein [Phycisphaerae bacterium]
MAEEIVITGLGVVSPIGCDQDRFWDSLCAGRSGAAPVDCLDTSELPRKIGCQVRQPIEVGRPMGRAAQLAVAASRQAIASAGLQTADLPAGRLAVTVGTTMGETDFIEERLGATEQDWLAADQMRRVVDNRPGSIARHVQADVGVTGPVADLYGACAAGNLAIAAARRSLLEGRSDVVLAGGADGFSRLAFLGFMRLRVMAAEVCRPFDEKRDGLLVGEGSAIFVLERESSARARGAAIRARVAGCGVTCESYHPTRPDPDGDGLTRAANNALAEAALKPEEIAYVCAHGTGTPQNDAIEVKVLQRCFPKGVAFSSIKALTGHTMGAAAAIEIACCVLSLEHQTLIPTWNLENAIPCDGLDALAGGPRPAQMRYVLNNSAGFGGYNSGVILAVA